MSDGKIGLDIRKGRCIYVRRRKWLKNEGEKGKMEQEVLFRSGLYDLPEKLNKEIIKEKKVTKNEQKQYEKLAAEYNEKQELRGQEVTITLLKHTLENALEAVGNKDVVSSKSVEELTELADIANKVKIALNKAKNDAKKKQAYLDKKVEKVLDPSAK